MTTMSFKDADAYLKNLPLKSYTIKELADIIRSVPTLENEGLFEEQMNDDFYKDNELLMHPKTGEKISILDIKVDMMYQRILKLRQLADHLRSGDKDDNPMNYDKMCAGSIDIAIRPDGEIYCWDGFRRCLIALLKGIQYPLFSIYSHPPIRTIANCRATEAFAFKKRNGDNESMARDELYKSGIVYGSTKDLETKEVLSESKIDVLKTIINAKSTLSGFAEYEDTIVRKKVSEKNLVLASTIVRKAWSTEGSVSSYVICGLGKYIELINTDALRDFSSYNITSLKDTCDFLPKFKKYAKNNSQNTLTKNRLSNYGIETIAFRIATKVIGGLTNTEQLELAVKLGFDEEGQLQIIGQKTIGDAVALKDKAA